MKVLGKEGEDSHARTIGGAILILVFVVGLLFVVYKAGSSLNPVEYEGRIVDKWAGYHHGDEGSTPYFRFMIETDNGQKLTVATDRDTYEQAKVGMRIRKTRTGVELNPG